MGAKISGETERERRETRVGGGKNKLKTTKTELITNN